MTSRDSEAAVAEVLDLEAGLGRPRRAAGRRAHTHPHHRGDPEQAHYLEHVKKNPRRTERRDLKVRVDVDAAVVTGPQINVIEADGETTEVAIEGLQVWARRTGSWRLVAFASSGRRPR